MTLSRSHQKARGFDSVNFSCFYDNTSILCVEQWVVKGKIAVKIDE